MHPVRRPLALLTALLLLAAACGTDGGTTTGGADTADAADAAGDAPTILATTTILADVTTNVVGELATVDAVMPEGVDPHDFEPSAQQVAALGEADLVIANGLLLEEGLVAVLRSIEDDGVPVIELAPELSPIAFSADMAEFLAEHGHTHGHGDDTHGHEDGHRHGDDGHTHGHGDDTHGHGDDTHGHEDGHRHGDDDHTHGHGDDTGDGDGALDPHVWQDPSRMATAAELIATAVAEHLDVDETTLEEQTDAYTAELEALDAEVEELLSAIPDDRRTLVTNHDAFGYFADRYDFEVLGTVIPSGSTLAEPSAAEIAELADTITDAGVPAIFGENVGSTELAGTLAREVDHDVAVVELYTDALGGAQSDAGTYVAMIRTNAERIADALS